MTLLEVRDSALARVGEVADFLSFEATLRRNDVGTWKLVLPASDPMAYALTFLGGITLRRDTGVLVSGFALSLDVVHDGRRELLTVQGVTDECVLGWRVAHPSPLTADTPGPTTGWTHDELTGPAETVMRHYVDRNLGPAALAPRQLTPGLVLEPDLARGATVTGRARFPNLLAHVQKLAAAGGVLFRVVPRTDGTPGWTFQVYEPADRTDEAVFGFDRHNLRSYGYGTTAPDATFIYGGGSNELELRAFYSAEDPVATAAYRRREDFYDLRNTDSVSEVQTGLAERQTDMSASSTLKLDPVDTPDLTYGQQYRLGDTVRVMLGEGASITDGVGQVRLTIDKDGERVAPVLASDGASLQRLALVDKLRRLGRRVTNLEVR